MVTEMVTPIQNTRAPCYPPKKNKLISKLQAVYEYWRGTQRMQYMSISIKYRRKWQEMSHDL